MPILDIGGGMFTAGLLSVALQYFDGQDSEVRATQRLERVLHASAPAMRDAVIDGFAFNPEDLARVATPETLDKIITNGLGIRLGDAGFGKDVYEDLRQQALGTPERLHDARVSIRLSMESSTALGSAALFVATVRWEFTVVPVHPARRFVCLSDRDEYRELGQDSGSSQLSSSAPLSGRTVVREDSGLRRRPGSGAGWMLRVSAVVDPGHPLVRASL